MFRLVKYLGGRINEAETRRITVEATNAEIKAGSPVNIKDGYVTPLKQVTGVIATHMVERAAAKGATELTVSEILPGMIYEVPLINAPDEPMLIYGEYVTDGQQMMTVLADPDMDMRGAVIYDHLGAKVKGDKMLVTFPVA